MRMTQVDRILAHLEVIVAAGRLPHCYLGAEDWLHDFWPDFAWNPEDSVDQIEEILGNSRLRPIAAFFQARYNFDLIDELKVALEEARTM